MQLRSILADQRGRDSLISAGTGSGKTLPIALCTLLDDPAKKKVTIVVSPLKRLQESQANEFTTRFGIRAVVINEDTPRDSTWWSVSHLFITYSTRIYLYIYRKTYSPLNAALKSMHNSSSSPWNSFFEPPRDISLEWLFYCDSPPSSLIFLGSVSMRLTRFILLVSLCMVYLCFGLPGEKFTSSKHLFGRPYPGISSWQLFRHTFWTWSRKNCSSQVTTMSMLLPIVQTSFTPPIKLRTVSRMFTTTSAFFNCRSTLALSLMFSFFSMTRN